MCGRIGDDGDRGNGVNYWGQWISCEVVPGESRFRSGVWVRVCSTKVCCRSERDVDENAGMPCSASIGGELGSGWSISGGAPMLTGESHTSGSRAGMSSGEVLTISSIALWKVWHTNVITSSDATSLI